MGTTSAVPYKNDPSEFIYAKEKTTRVMWQSAASTSHATTIHGTLFRNISLRHAYKHIHKYDL